MSLTLPSLPNALDALDPHISLLTVDVWEYGCSISGF